MLQGQTKIKLIVDFLNFVSKKESQ